MGRVGAVQLMEWSQVIPIIATLFGALVSILLGMAIAKLTGIETHLERLNGKVFDHITKQGIHESAVGRIDEQIKNLLQTVTVAHERIDRVEEKT